MKTTEYLSEIVKKATKILGGECPNGTGLLKRHSWKRTVDIRRCRNCGRCEYESAGMGGWWLPFPKQEYDSLLKHHKEAKENRLQKKKEMEMSWQQK